MAKIASKKEKIEYSEKFVVFIDILGFKNFINGKYTKPELTIRYLYESIEHAINQIKNNSQYTIKPQLRLFSDCICISCDPIDFGQYTLGILLQHISDLQLNLAINGIFIRGGLSLGLHYENNYMIFSKGLISSYELEKKANYPRIVLSNKCIKIFNKIPIFENSKRFIIKSSDGIYSIDYLESIFPYVSRINILATNFFRHHKKAINWAMDQNKRDSHTLDKYRWLSDYHNEKVRMYVGKNNLNSSKALIDDITIDMNNKIHGFKKYYKDTNMKQLAKYVPGQLIR